MRPQVAQGRLPAASKLDKECAARSHLPFDEHLPDLGDGLGGVEALPAGLGAIHDGVAAVEPERVLKIVEPFAACLVAAVHDPALRLQQDGRPEEALAGPPIAGTAGAAAGAENAFVESVDLARSAGVCFHSFSGVGVTVLSHGSIEAYMTTELVYAPDGSATAVRHAWTFDDMFSAFATQGIAARAKGQFTRAELQPLAQTNIESLKEYAYFTYAQIDGRMQKDAFGKPSDYWLDYDPKGTVTYAAFHLAVQKTGKGKPTHCRNL